MMLRTCTCRFLADNPNTEWIQKSEGHKGVKASQVQGSVKGHCVHSGPLQGAPPLDAGD